MKIKDQQIQWNEETNQTYLVTLFENGSIQSEPLTSEQASQWQVEHKF